MTAPSFDIEIQNRSGDFPATLSSLRRLACRILKSLGWKRAGLSILLVNDRRIRRLNRRYLKKDRKTDVISFSQLEGVGPNPVGGRPVFLGDVVISVETVSRQAEEYGHGFVYELAFCLCHGILHLMGYRDRTKKEALGMEKKQKKILNRVRIRRSVTAPGGS